MGIFNNREIALASWVLIGIIASFFNTTLRRSLGEIPSIMFKKQLVGIYLIVVLHFAFCIWVLYQVRLWDYTLLKDAILWVLFVGFITVFRLNQVSENKNYFRDAILDNLKLTVLLEFIVGLYTFSLVAEFIIVPIAIFIVLLLEVAKTNQKYEAVRKVVSFIVIVYSVFLLSYSIYHIISNFKDFATVGTLRSFFLAPLLSVLFLPLIYCMSVYMIYETTFIVIRRAIPVHLLGQARKYAIIQLGLNTSALIRWRSGLFRKEVRTSTDILNSIEEIKKRQAIEKRPPPISYEDGWSPFEAKNFLAKEGIPTGYYNHSWEKDWSAMSTYVNLDNSIIPNNIAYYVCGSEFAATKLWLVANISSLENSILAHKALVEYSKVLYKKALRGDFPEVIENALWLGENQILTLASVNISVSKNIWESKIPGYNLNFEIKHVKDNSSLSV
ncbi:hypothetical protein [Chitinophaga sp.]|uniref:hypothetical protein n=1 Tax=Chitinophaga sp. TaxID=1869181 RepID=UPI0031D2542D